MGTMSVASLVDSSQRDLTTVEKRRWSTLPDVEATLLPDSPCGGARLKVRERVTEEVKVVHPVSAIHPSSHAHQVTPTLALLHQDYQLRSQTA
jgi:hypothetical protein